MYSSCSASPHPRETYHGIYTRAYACTYAVAELNSACEASLAVHAVHHFSDQPIPGSWPTDIDEETNDDESVDLEIETPQRQLIPLPVFLETGLPRKQPRLVQMSTGLGEIAEVVVTTLHIQFNLKNHHPLIAEDVRLAFEGLEDFEQVDTIWHVLRVLKRRAWMQKLSELNPEQDDLYVERKKSMPVLWKNYRELFSAAVEKDGSCPSSGTSHTCREANAIKATQDTCIVVWLTIVVDYRYRI